MIASKLTSLAILLLLLFGASSLNAQVILDPGTKEDKKDKKKDKKDKKTKKDKEKDRSKEQKKSQKSCPEGQKISSDTAGQCCWPGQSWNGERCVGEPTSCPAGFVASGEAQACVLPDCVAGRVRASDGIHCCWPEQAWSSSQDSCIGLPACPAGTIAMQEQCDPDPDGDGLLALDDSCPEAAEDFDQHEDADGCPDIDNDGDGRCDSWTKDDPIYQDYCSDYALDSCEDLAADTADGCPQEAPTASASGPSIWSWVVLGSGVVLGATGLGLHLMAEADRDELRDLLANEEQVESISRAEALRRQDDADALDTTGAILAGVGGLALIVGGGLLALTWSDEAPTPTAILDPDGAFHFGLSGRF